MLSDLLYKLSEHLVPQPLLYQKEVVCGLGVAVSALSTGWKQSHQWYVVFPRTEGFSGKVQVKIMWLASALSIWKPWLWSACRLTHVFVLA